MCPAWRLPSSTWRCPTSWRRATWDWTGSRPEEFTGAPLDVLDEPDLLGILLETTGEDLVVSQEDLSVSEVLSASKI